MGRRSTARAAAAAAIVVAMAAGCGGGGGPAGQCLFPPACNQIDSGGGGLGTPSTPAPVSFFKQGTGASVFSLPATLTTVRIQGQTAGTSANFIIYAGNSLLVNSLVGSSNTPAKHDGVYAVPAGTTLDVRNATAVDWIVSSAVVDAPSNPAALFSRSGVGDAVFLLPSRAAKYRIQGAFPGATSNFIVRAGGNLIVNALIGSSYTPSAFDGTYSLGASAQVEITNSNGVSWSFVEVL